MNPRRSRKYRLSKLLRAANIPARYQFGTIEVGTEQLQNWVGGATKAEAAQQIIAQGGIANRGLIEGGRFAKVRMEHVWVLLDASYKKCNYSDSLDLKLEFF